MAESREDRPSDHTSKPLSAGSILFALLLIAIGAAAFIRRRVRARRAPRCEEGSNTDSDTTCRNEVIIGIVGAMGTNLVGATSLLKDLLSDYNYGTEIIRLSALIQTVPPFSAIDRFQKLDRAKYYNALIDGGNYIRANLGNAGLADMVITEAIPASRTRLTSDGHKRRAYILHSLKHPDEVRRLREVYGSLFYCVGVYAHADRRLARQTEAINRTQGSPDDIEGLTAAEKLLRRDERESLESGQKVSDTFAQADYFIRSDDVAELRTSLQRFLDLVFDRPYISPTRGEVAMAHAHSAALRSADLSRQVGAVIAARDGRVLTTGCNDVPAPGGGQYWVGDADDKRDFQLGKDMNDEKKRDAIVELLKTLDGQIIPEMLLDGVEKLFGRLNDTNLFAGTRIDSLIEFGRVVHAEMAALNGAAVDAISVRDCDLYCTTFPCHMCTRLIITAGIRNVFYIEPYPKSAALELYSDSILVNPDMPASLYHDRITDGSTRDKRVHFMPFEGVAPRRYRDVFSNRSRKDKKTGKTVPFSPTTAVPRQAPCLVAAHLNSEREIKVQMEDRIRELRHKGRRLGETPL